MSELLLLVVTLLLMTLLLVSDGWIGVAEARHTSKTTNNQQHFSIFSLKLFQVVVVSMSELIVVVGIILPVVIVVV